jgi:hypothetical protein
MGSSLNQLKVRVAEPTRAFPMDGRIRTSQDTWKRGMARPYRAVCAVALLGPHPQGVLVVSLQGLGQVLFLHLPNAP